MSQQPPALEADVVIVGAGVSGALAGWSLAQAGARVVILEAGPSTDRAQAVQAARAAIAKTPESAYPQTAYAPRPDTADLRNYYVQDGPDLFKSTYERRVGGTTWHWLGTSLRLLPNDFQVRTTYGVGTDWPLGYTDLEPWYGQAERALGVAGDPNADLGVTRGTPYPMPPIPSTYLDQQVAAAARSIGLKVENTPQARNSQLYDGRPPCCGNHNCIPVCPIQAKYDATSHTAKAQQAGARVLEQSVAYAVDVDGGGRVSGIRFKRPDATEGSATARIYVLAAHAIETAKLLLISRSAALPNGVANSSDQVGRNLMDHPVQLSWGLTRDPVYPYRGPLATSGIEMLRDGSFRRTRGAFRVEIGNDGWSWPVGDLTAQAATYISQGKRGTALIDYANERASRQIRFASLVEQLGDPNNRVTPAFDQVDALGIPRPRIRYRVDRYTLDGMAAARDVHTRLFTALGATEVQHQQGFEGAGHIMGTYRMGSDPKTSVVDRNLRAHDHPNLYLLGSGVFPSVGSSNPTLTIAALALRAAATIRGELGR
jgi:glucose dehydrogenase